MGCGASSTSRVIAALPPRSMFPWRLSASSSNTSFRPPEPPVSVPDLAASPATRSTTSAVRWSLAFNSTTSQPASFASAWAADVFPMPGLP